MRDGDAATTVADYGFLSDCQSAALISTRGSIDWWCVPRFDSPSIFGRLLDPAAGHWALAPVEEFTVTRDYVGDSLVLRTQMRTANGGVAVTDALSLAPGARGHEIGMHVPHTLLRTVEGVQGEVECDVVVAPRLEYGLTLPRWGRSDDGSWTCRAGPVGLQMHTDVPLDPGGGDLRGRFSVRAGDQVAFRLAYAPPYDDVEPLRIDSAEALEETIRGWQSWSDQHQRYQGRYRTQVHRSALVLQGLTYQPSGAIVAAATTSLPEELGGTLNWDYRFAWLRDISLAMQALWVAACPDEANRFFDWVAGAMGQLGGAPLQIMYGVTGERDLTEHSLDHLAGYRDSRPVRVGNDAWRQRQLDVLGEVLFAADLLRDQLGELDEPTRELLVSLADQAAADWTRPDAGMWEARGTERHYTSSKVMCWVALDRAVRLADRLGPRARPAEWARARDEVHAAVLEQAWCEEIGTFAGAFGSDRLDASLLLIPLVGFLPAADPRMLATIDAIRDQLADGALIRRWKGDTAGFTISSFWMVECLALAGRVEEATASFEQLLDLAGDLGLYAEEIDPGSGEQLGNYPQAFSHIGLVNAAWQLTRAGEGIGRGRTG